MVFKALSDRLDLARAAGITDTSMLADELVSELGRIGNRIQANPGILHNNIMGKATGYAEKRYLYLAKDIF